MQNNGSRKRPGKFFSNIFFIGLLSFFGGISQDIFLPVLPLYLANFLGLSKEFIGTVEGLATSSASIFKIIAGFISDKIKKRKAIIFAGYTLSLIGRFFLAFTSSALAIGVLRLFDGSGKGAKDTPKDALIADSAGIQSRGKGFGIVRALDTLGSVAGPLILFAILELLKNNTLKYHYIFLITAIPLAFTLAILGIFVRERSFKKTQSESTPDLIKVKLPKKFYIFMGIMSLFALGDSPDAFLILRASNVGVTLLAIPLVYALFNFVYASASIPLGSLSDKIGRVKVILIGWFAYAFAYAGFGLASKAYHIWILYAFYGIYYATTEGVAKAFVADLVSSDRRGRAYGIYNAIIGIIALPAGVIAGFLWDRINPSAPFFFGGIIAGVAAILLIIFSAFYKNEHFQISA